MRNTFRLYSMDDHTLIVDGFLLEATERLYVVAVELVMNNPYEVEINRGNVTNIFYKNPSGSSNSTLIYINNKLEVGTGTIL